MRSVTTRQACEYSCLMFYFYLWAVFTRHPKIRKFFENKQREGLKLRLKFRFDLVRHVVDLKRLWLRLVWVELRDIETVRSAGWCETSYFVLHGRDGEAEKWRKDRATGGMREREKLDMVTLSQSAHLTLLTFFPWHEIIQSNQLDHSWNGN